MMGMGEPLANYDSVTAIRRMNTELGIGARLTISTVGLAPRIGISRRGHTSWSCHIASPS